MKLSLPIAATAQPLNAESGKSLARWSAGRGLLRLVSGNHVLAGADQAVVSATSFLTLIMIARWTDANQLGAYAIGASILALLLATQDALITRPYAIQLYRPLGTPAEHAFSSLLLSFLLSATGMFVLSAAALALSAFGAHRQAAEITWALAGTIPFVLLREFARRFAFAHLKILQALTVDVVVAALNVVLLGWLGWTGRLSAVTAFVAVGISCAIGAIGWLYLARSEFAFRLGQVRATLKQSWVLGKWLFSGQLALQTQGYMTYWLSMVIAGATVTGIYAACTSIVAFANPLLFGFFNILTPKSVRALQIEGGAGLRRQAARDSLLFAAVMTPFCVLVFLVGEDVMGFLYPGPEYRGNGHILAVLALAGLAAAIGAPASIALASAERARAAAGVTAATAIFSLILIGWLMTTWGLLGAAYGLLIAEAAGNLGRWIAFLALVPGTHRPRRDADRQSSAPVDLRLEDRNSPGGALSAQAGMTLAKDVAQDDGPGRILSGVFETLDRAGIRYCVLHGYENYPQRIGSDVDCVIDPETTPAQIYALLHRNSARIGAEIVRCRGYHIVLAGKNADGSPCFLTLDLSVDCELNDVAFYPGTQVLANRRRYRQFWIPAANLAFGCYLVRTVAKGCLDDERARKLSNLYQQDAAGCDLQVARFWATRGTELILSAAKSGDWKPVRQSLGSLRAELRRRAILRRPSHFLGNKLRGLLDRMRRVWQPDGLNVVLLGPDGAGKSSVIEALGPRLASAFARSACWGFAPPLHRLLRQRDRSTNQPHALPARSFLTSLVRAAYWFVYYTFGHVIRHLALARSTLVLNDRHFVDILVDPKRYRYGGPSWLLRLIWLVIPKPDLIVLLDAPPEVLQARKQEVSFEETVRQRRAYLSLIRTMGNGHVVDATQSLDHVAGDVSDMILRHLTMRIARRFGPERNVPGSIHLSTFAQTLD